MAANGLNIDDFLEKPFTPSTLLDALKSVLTDGDNPGKKPHMDRQWAIEPQKGLTDAKILLVEDNAINQRVAKKNDFHCILMDIQMPEMDANA